MGPGVADKFVKLVSSLIHQEANFQILKKSESSKWKNSFVICWTLGYMKFPKQ